MPYAATTQPESTCDTCFFGVEQLCCLRPEASCCATYRRCDDERAACLRRSAQDPPMQRYEPHRPPSR